MSRNREMQRIIRHYKDETGTKEVDMREVVKWAVDHGWPLPKPVDPFDRLAKEFAAAAREETKNDKVTGKPYRVNHAVPTTTKDGQVVMFWVDIDEAPRTPMLKALTARREQMVGDAFQLTLDVDHWNSINAKDEPIQMQLDLTDDVEWRKNAPDEEKDAS